VVRGCSFGGHSSSSLALSLATLEGRLSVLLQWWPPRITPATFGVLLPALVGRNCCPKRPPPKGAPGDAPWQSPSGGRSGAVKTEAGW